MGKATRGKRKGSSKAGRPKKGGDRYPGGKLKPAPQPNQIMLDRRAELCDDVTMASCPLDAAYANGWLTLKEHRTGEQYALLRRLAVPGRPGMAAGGAHEADISTVGSAAPFVKNMWAIMPDAQIKAIWDAAFREVRQEGDLSSAEKREAQARERSRSADTSMTHAERREVELICIHQEWPEWFAARRAGDLDQAGYRLLVSGLRKIAASWKPKADNENRPGSISPVPYRPSLHGTPVDRETHVNENGEVVLEVERVRRR